MESVQDINLIKQVTTLVADVKNLKEGQDTFHREMKDSFKELKDGYAKRIDDHDIDIKKLQFKNMFYSGALGVITFCGLLIGYIYFTQQQTQDREIDRCLSALNLQ